jgi:hypothetical protein
MYPLARREGLMVCEVADRLLVYDRWRQRVHSLHPVAAWVWRRCDGRTPVSLLARHLRWAKGITHPIPVVYLSLEYLARCRLLARPGW